MIPKHDKSGMAFPIPADATGPAELGLSIRDYFAAAALPALLAAAHNAHGHFYHDSFNLTSETAYNIADAMLKAREEAKP